MALCSLQPSVYQVFLLAGVHEVFPIYVGLDEILVGTEDEEKESP